MSSYEDFCSVCKFGGSSLANAALFAEVCRLVRSDPSRRYIVLSAPGKTAQYDTKMTDILYSMYDHKDDYEPFLQIITEKIVNIADSLGLDKYSYMLKIKDELMSAISAGRQALASRGEYFSALLFAEYTGFAFVDTAEVIKFGRDGKPDLPLSLSLIRRKTEKLRYAVFPGFYGSDENGRIVTFSRGGSDITGSIVALAVNADIYENFTDVPGIMSANPKVADDPPVIRSLDYSELRRLSYMGASVLHESSVIPLRGSRIPINIKSSFEPDLPGSMIVEAIRDRSPALLGVSGKSGFIIIDILFESDMRSDNVFLLISSVFSDSSVYIEQITAGTDGFSVIIREALPEDVTKLLKSLCSHLSPIAVSVEYGISLVAVVGRKITSCGILYSAMSSLSDRGILPYALFSNNIEDELIFAVADRSLSSCIKIVSKALDNK